MPGPARPARPHSSHVRLNFAARRDNLFLTVSSDQEHISGEKTQTMRDMRERRGLFGVRYQQCGSFDYCTLPPCTRKSVFARREKK